MKKGEDAIAYTRKQFRDSIEIQIYIYEYDVTKYYIQMISCISKINHKTKIR